MSAALPGDRRTSTVLKVVALLYGHGDVAWNVTAPERRGGTSLFRDGRWLLAAVFHRLWKLSQPRSTGWSVSRSELGNFD
jgi:hypothetical protein